MKLLLLLTISLSAFGACGPLAPNPITGILDCTGSGGGGGGSGTVTSVGLDGTANQIEVTGASPITGSGSWTLSFPAGGVTLPGMTTITSLKLEGNTDSISTEYTYLRALSATIGAYTEIGKFRCGYDWCNMEVDINSYEPVCTGKYLIYSSVATTGDGLWYEINPIATSVDNTCALDFLNNADAVPLTLAPTLRVRSKLTPNGGQPYTHIYVRVKMLGPFEGLVTEMTGTGTGATVTGYLPQMNQLTRPVLISGAPGASGTGKAGQLATDANYLYVATAADTWKSIPYSAYQTQGSSAFSAVTAGTNTAALVVGTGGSLGVSGSGTIAATSLAGALLNLNAVTGISTGVPFRINASVVDAGLGNTFVGPATGNATTSGDQNTGFGDKVLRSVTTGDHNVGIGPGTLDALTSGNNNVALGHAAGLALITGDDNLMIGNSTAQNATALGVKNVFIGTGVAANVTTGSAVDHSVGIGGDALNNLTTGTFNTSIGGDSGKGVTTGDANVFIGDAADTTNGANSFGIAIGFAAKTNATQAVAIGQGIVNAVANSVNLGTNSKIMLALASAVAVSALPTCDSTYLGAIRSVTDATAPAWGVTVVGTGAVPAGVRCNGTTWTVYAI